MASRAYAAGDVVMRAGACGDDFVLVESGLLVVGLEPVHRHAGPGAIAGELSLLTGRPRGASVVATEPTSVLVGARSHLDALLAVDLVRDRLAHLVSRRLAPFARPVQTVAPLTGETLIIRPLLPSDRQGYLDAVHHMSRESIRRRFFTGGAPPDSVLDLLVDVDFLDHFAWVVTTEAEPDRGLAVGRSIRHAERLHEAELAFGVIDDQQGRGLGTLLLGALGAAASASDLTVLTADVLADNLPMRGVLAKAHPDLETIEPGLLRFRFPAERALVLPAALTSELAESVRDVVTAAGLVHV